jgi:hypothetical protein
LRIKEQETRLNIHEHDDDDEENLSNVRYVVLKSGADENLNYHSLQTQRWGQQAANIYQSTRGSIPEELKI